MSVTATLNSTMEEKALGFVNASGKTLEQLFLDYLEWAYKRNLAQEEVSSIRPMPSRTCDLSLDPELKAEISDADRFSDDSGMWDACHA